MASILDNASVRHSALAMSVEQYHRLGSSGIIPERTELLRGYVIEKMNKSPDHTFLVESISDWLRVHAIAGTYVRQEQPLTLADSEPEPDLALVEGSLRDYRHAHPHKALVVVEVAVSSADVDYEKKSIYAEAGIPEYAIVLATERRVEVYADPGPSGYGRRVDLAENDRLALAAIPAAELDLRRLFP